MEDGWVWIIAAAGALLLLLSVLKSVVGLALQYFIFVAMAGFIYAAQREEETRFLDAEVLGAIATIGGLAFAFSLGVMALLFRNSKFKTVLFPVVGFATTFAAAAMVTQ
ncbi:hypothetical protein [Parvularcula marina]|uniref:Uncharacterized protein n=1 Tax=Parvularcula marina TaxID=2292771 RepID=A0A371REE5_9PROT|nr:hypothetical protein [Parvularcula marina]RFB03818.1 hypothetical protein DX908_00090 [Parvularcula marina]